MKQTKQFGFAYRLKKTDELREEQDLELQIKQAAQMGFEGIELDSGLLSTLPDSNAPAFFNLCENYRIDPSCYVIQNRPDNHQNIETSQPFDPAVLIQHFHTARYLGFPNVRFSHPLPHHEFCSLVPYAVQCGIWLGMEIDQTQGAQAQITRDCMDLIDRFGSKHTGFILNYSVLDANDEGFLASYADGYPAQELIRFVLPHTRMIRILQSRINPESLFETTEWIKPIEILKKSRYFDWAVFDEADQA